MSHHYSGPNLVFPRGDARLDYSDLFAFPKPGDPSTSILIMDVHPSFDVLKSGPTTAEPFFFDAGAFNNFQFTGTDFFADKDICSIALEVPNATLGPKLMGLWARTVIQVEGAGGGWVQAERGARASQTPFLTGEQNEAYRAAGPADDARFVGTFAHSLEHTGGFAPVEARRVAGTLLPDLLYYDPTRPASYPDNGRKPSDDAADAFLIVITNGKVTGDGIGPHGDLLTEFPYLGSPHDGSR